MFSRFFAICRCQNLGTASPFSCAGPDSPHKIRCRLCVESVASTEKLSTAAAGSGGARLFCHGLAKGRQGLVAPTCLLSPFPLAGPLVVVGKTALDQIAAPLIARHDEGSETAAAEAKRAKRYHNDDLQPQLAHDPSLGLFQQPRQLGEIGRNPPRLGRMYAGRGHTTPSSEMMLWINKTNLIQIKSYLEREAQSSFSDWSRGMKKRQTSQR